MTLNSGSKAVCPSRNYGRASTKEILTEVKGNLEAQYESASLLQEVRVGGRDERMYAHVEAFTAIRS